MPQKKLFPRFRFILLGFSSLGNFSPLRPDCLGSLKLQFLFSRLHEVAYSSAVSSSSWQPLSGFLVSCPEPRINWCPQDRSNICRKLVSTTWTSFLSRPVLMNKLLKYGSPAAIRCLQTDVFVLTFYLYFELFSVRALICYKLLHHNQKWK